MHYLAEYFVQLKQQLETAPQGDRGGIVAKAAAFLNCGTGTVYRKLAGVGWASGRKTRSDCGKLCVDESLAITAAGMIKAATRANGKKTLPLTTVVDILKENGMGVINEKTGEVAMPSPSTIARAMRAHGCHPGQIAKGAPAQTMRSLHPNHTWQMDASVCTMFYLPKGRVQIMEDNKFYKNKPHNLEKVVNKRVIRWVITDHYSGAIYAQYTEGNEDATSAIDVLIEAMCEREHPQDILYGAPFQFYTDKGAPFVASMTKNFFKRIGVKAFEHAAGNARATGQVENAQNIVETQFEGRLRFLKIDSLETLNRHLNDWRIKWNATAIHRRHGKSRNQVWMGITKEQLRIPDSVEALRAIVASKGIERTVNGRMVLEYAPKGYGQHRYKLTDIEGLKIGQKIHVSVNPYSAPAVDVTVTAANGEERIYTLQPIQLDSAGFDMNAPIIGQEMRSLKDTATDKAIKRMEREAYGASTQEEADKARKAGKQVYSNINVMADIEAAANSIRYFPKQGSAINLDAPTRELPPLNLAEAAMQLKATLAAQGIAWTEAHMAHIAQHYSAGVPHDAIDGLVTTFIALAAPAPVASITQYEPLRRVAGGAA